MKVLIAIFAVLISQAAFAQEEETSCPAYSHQACGSGERLDIEKDENGCDVATCVKTASTKVDEAFDQYCPAPDQGLCSSQQVESSFTDANGCKATACLPKPN
ncbi:MAG: hypothetical protein AB7K68_03970 [Bacteriovoracia bacterium]